MSQGTGLALVRSSALQEPKEASRAAAAPPGEWRAFPLGVLPPVVRAVVEELSASVGCDPSVVATAALVVLAGCIGSTRRMRLKSSWTEATVLWAGIVARRDPALTQALDVLLEPLRDHQDWELDEYRESRSHYAQDMRRYHKQLRQWENASPDFGIKRPDDVQTPTASRFFCDSVDIETIAALHEDNQHGLLVVRPRLEDWLARVVDGARRDGGPELAQWLHAHRGTMLVVDRLALPRRTFCARHPAVSVLGAAHPDSIRRLLPPGDGMPPSDLMQRLLLVMPPGGDGPATWDDRETEVGEQTLSDFSRLCGNLLGMGMDGETPDGQPAPRLIPLDAAAREAWAAFYNEHMVRMSEAAPSHWGDDVATQVSPLEELLPSLVARLALIHWLGRAASPAGLEDDKPADADKRNAASDGDDREEEDDSEGGDDAEGDAASPSAASPESSDEPPAPQIDRQAIEAAIALARWFADESARVYASLAYDVDQAQRQQLIDFIAAHGGSVTLRDVMRSGPRFPTADAAREALDELAQHHAGTWADSPTRSRVGRPTQVFRLHESHTATHDTASVVSPLSAVSAEPVGDVGQG